MFRIIYFQFSKMEKKVRSVLVSGCDYYGPYPTFKVDPSKTKFLGECYCGQGGCLVFEEFELLENENENTDPPVEYDRCKTAVVTK